MTELSFVYVDLGDDRYKVMVAEMVASARRVMPDVKITQISDNKTPMYPGVDGFFQANVACDKEMICAFKLHFMADFAKKCADNLILCDVDLLWRKSPVEVFSRLDADKPIGLMWRSDMPSMPYNTGVIFSTKDAFGWWEECQAINDDLHQNGLGGWYCDQLAVAIAADDHVLRLPMHEIAYAPSTANDGGGDASYAVHLKGNRKQWLLNYLEQGRRDA